MGERFSDSGFEDGWIQRATRQEMQGTCKDSWQGNGGLQSYKCKKPNLANNVNSLEVATERNTAQLVPSLQPRRNPEERTQPCLA